MTSRGLAPRAELEIARSIEILLEYTVRNGLKHSVAWQLWCLALEPGVSGVSIHGGKTTYRACATTMLKKGLCLLPKRASRIRRTILADV